MQGTVLDPRSAWPSRSCFQGLWNQVPHHFLNIHRVARAFWFCGWFLSFETSVLPHMAVCQNLVPLVNIKIAGKWMFIPLKMVLIGIDPYPYEATHSSWDLYNHRISAPGAGWDPLVQGRTTTGRWEVQWQGVAMDHHGSHGGIGETNGFLDGWWSDVGMGQYLLIPFWVGWTSILTQLFWCELQGYKVLTHWHVGDPGTFGFGDDLMVLIFLFWAEKCGIILCQSIWTIYKNITTRY